MWWLVSLISLISEVEAGESEIHLLLWLYSEFEANWDQLRFLSLNPTPASWSKQWKPRATRCWWLKRQLNHTKTVPLTPHQYANINEAPKHEHQERFGKNKTWVTVQGGSLNMRSKSRSQGAWEGVVRWGHLPAQPDVQGRFFHHQRVQNTSFSWSFLAAAGSLWNVPVLGQTLLVSHWPRQQSVLSCQPSGSFSAAPRSSPSSECPQILIWVTICDLVPMPVLVEMHLIKWSQRNAISLPKQVLEVRSPSGGCGPQRAKV